MKDRFNDFSGGISDFRFNTASNYSERMDNWTLLRDKSMEVRWGFDFYNISAPRIPTNRRVSEIKDIAGDLVFFSQGKAFYIDGGFQEIQGPSGNTLLDSSDPSNMVSSFKYGDIHICTDDSNSSFPVKVFRDELGNYKGVNAGLPKPISEPTITVSNPDNRSYSYAFCYKYSYRVGTTLYIDRGTPLYVQVEDGADIEVNPHTISSYLELTNGPLRNYDTVNIEKEIYRTVQNGTEYFLLDSIPNSQTVYTDNTTDTDLVKRERIYTTGGIRPNDLPPQAKYITVTNGVGVYANIVESGESKPYRLKMSKEGDPDSVPEDFIEDFESDIMGVASINDRTIVLTQRKVVALEGIIDDLGRGIIRRRTVIDTGCVGNGSIVTTQEYVYWFSEDGIYRTDGVKYEKLTHHLSKSHQVWTESTNKCRAIKGAYDNVNQRVEWCINQKSSDNDSILVYDEILGGFVRHHSDLDMSPSAILFKNQGRVRADSDGYVFVHNKDLFSDLVKDQFKAIANWQRKVIPYDWKHIAWNMGDSERLKWVKRINVVGRPETNIYLEPRTYREGSPDFVSLSPMKFIPLIKWGEPSIVWGDPTVRWNSVDYFNQSKRMHRKAMRTTHLQLSLASSYSVIQSSGSNSDSYVMVNALAKSASLINPSIYSFIKNLDGYIVKIDSKEYTILSSSPDTIIIDDPEGTLVDGNYEYEISGKPKAQRPHISEVSIIYEMFGHMDKLEANT